MKRIFYLLALIGLFGQINSEAQIPFGSGVLVNGTSNSVCVLTNGTLNFQVPSFSLIQASGGTNANTTFIGQFWLSLTNPATAGGFNVTNSIMVGAITNAVGSGSFTTNSVSFSTNIPIYFWMLCQSTTNGLQSNSISVLTSPVNH